MKTLKRYIILYGHLIAFSFGKAANFRFDFWFRTVMDIAYYAMGLMFFKVMYLHTSTLAGWNEDQAFIFIAGFFFVDALMMTTLSGNCWFIPKAINDGELDYYLIRPVSSMFFLCLRDFAVGSFANLFVATGILMWAINRSPVHYDALLVAAYVGLLFLGFVIYGVMRILSVVPAFWLESGRGLEQLFFNLMTVMEKPEGIFHGWVKRVLTTIVPVCLVASLPAKFLFGGGSVGLAIHMIVVCGASLAVLALFWNRAVRAYSSASS